MSDENTTRRLSQIFGSLSCLSDLQGNDSPRHRQPQNTINPVQFKYLHDNPSDPQQQQQQQQQQTKNSSTFVASSSASLPIQGLQFQFSSLQQQQQQHAIPSSSSSNQIKTNQRSSTHLIHPTTQQHQHILMMGSRSTPNSPRLMPKRSGIPPAIPKRPAPTDPMANPDLMAIDSETVWPHLSLLTDNLDVHQVNNYNHQGLLEINWQERCLELQLELHRSKNQAGRIRDMLRDKLSELEQRVLEADSRAEEAEEKVRAMEQRLTEWPKTTTTLVTQQELNTDTEKTISQLEVQIEEQRLLRLQDAKQVEAKAEKIKIWVTNKLRDLEEQNQVLREQNSICNNQLEIIRNYLATQSYRNSANNNNNNNTNNNPLRNSLSLDVTDRKQRNSRRRSESLDPPENRQLRPLNPNHPSYPYKHRRNLSMEPNDLARDLAAAIDGLNLIPLPNKNVIDINDVKNDQSSGAAIGGGGGGGGVVNKENTGHDYAEIYTPSREKAPLWLKGVLPASGGQTIATSSIKSDSTIDLDAPRPPTPPLHRFPSWEAKIYQVANDGLTANAENEHVSRERNSNIALNNNINNNNNNNDDKNNNNNNNAEGDVDDVDVDGGGDANGDVSIDVDVNVDIGVGVDVDFDVNDDNNNNNNNTNNNNNHHKHNIDYYYNANNDVGNAATNVSTSAHDFGRITPRTHTVSGGYCDISVPVYATVKGRASQIRSMPFTGDSSDDSSDGEDHPALMTCTTSTHNSHNSSSTDNTETNTSGSASSPSKSLKTSSNLSPAKRSGSESPKNQIDRDGSFVSGMSDDYAIPPDAVSQSESTCVDTSIPSLMMRVSYVDSPNKKIESFEKIGHLAKLGGKLKTWRKRWFVLKNETLTYWKSQNDVNRKPQGQILLDESCRITRADGASTFEIDTGKKVYYLTADSNATIDDWIRVLQNVQQRYATKLLLSRDDQKATVQGWVTKVKNGHAKKCWCVLLGKMFLYFKAPAETNPLGQINMRDARVEEVEHVSDSDTEERESNGPSQARFTVAIFPANQGPTYLILPGKSERDNWLYHLTIVSGGSPNAGTQYEQIIQRLMAIDGDPLAPMWRHPILLHVKEHISSPLSTLHSEMLQREAINLFKSCQLFMSVAVNQPGIDYHVVLAQNALQQCLDIPELQAELVCALIKQTSRHLGHKIGAGVQIPLIPPIDCKSNPPAYTFIQGWQLLSLAISLFIPKNNKLLWYLKLHLSRNADSKTECGKYAAYCERALERTILNGGREAKPSRMEVLSILMKNPYHHSLPHAIPVHMMNGTYQVISFDGSTSIEEFHSTLSQEIGCRESTNGFCLCSDDPIERDLEHYLDPQAKLCDVISKWETALREKGSGKFENSRVIQLTYKNRLYWKHSIKLETDKEKLLLCYQINQQIVHGRFPLSRDLAVELASLMAQIDMGDFSTEKCRGSANILASVQALDKFYPYRYRDAMTPEQLKELQEILVSKWILLKGRSTLDCVRIYLTCCRKWPYFGASLFQAKLRHSDQTIAWLAVSEDALNVLELSSMAPLARYPYSSVITFGGCQDDFMLVVANNINNTNNNNNNGTATTTIISGVVGDGGGGRSSNITGGAYTVGTNTNTTTINSDELHQYHTLVHLGGGVIGMPSGSGMAATNEQKLLFAMSKPKILEITLLIADYMNALGHTCPGTPQMNTLTRNGSHRSIRSRPIVGSSIGGGGGGGIGTISSIGGASGSGGMAIGTIGGCCNTSTIGSGVTQGGFSSMGSGGGGGGGGSIGTGSNTGGYCPNSTTSTINTLHSHISSHYMLNSNHLNMHNSHNSNSHHNSQPHQPDILKSTPDHQRINKL